MHVTMMTNQSLIVAFASELRRLLNNTRDTHQSTRVSFVVACSGGADSIAVARAFVELAGVYSDYLTPYAIDELLLAHVQHNIQSPVFQERENRVVEEMAHKYRLALRRHSLRWKQGESINEMSARKKRLEALARIAVEERISYIVTGHHASDARETFLMRMFGGEGLQGMKGMQQSRYYRYGTTGLWYIKPALTIDKNVLRSLSTEETTHKEQAMPNRRADIRSSIVPAILNTYPSVDISLQRISKQVSDVLKVVRKETPQWFRRETSLWISFSRFIGLPRALRLQLLYDGATLLGLRRISYQSLTPFLCEQLSPVAKVSVQNTKLQVRGDELVWHVTTCDTEHQLPLDLPYSITHEVSSFDLIGRSMYRLAVTDLPHSNSIDGYIGSYDDADAQHAYPLLWKGILYSPLMLQFLHKKTVVGGINVYDSLRPNADNPVPMIQDAGGSVLVLGACQLKRDYFIPSTRECPESDDIMFSATMTRSSAILDCRIFYGFRRFTVICTR